MADVLVDSQRRVLISGYGLLPQPVESLLLGRLDQIDLRLRQLEEQQERGPSPAAQHQRTKSMPAAAQHQHTKSMPAALHQHQHQHVQVRGDLMDRLNLLESRIRQLSCELGLDVAKAVHHHHNLGLGLGLGSSSSSSVPPVEDPTPWSDSAPVAAVDPAFGKAQSKPAAGGSWSAVELLQRGARQLHRSTSQRNPPTKVSKVKEAKRACQKEKMKAERSRNVSLTSRLWLMVGGSGCKP